LIIRKFEELCQIRKLDFDILGVDKENAIRQGVAATAHELDREGSDEEDHP
jgi:hypothetical protein